MNSIVWDQVGSRKYEVGVDRGVLYEYTPDGFTNGVAWNGLVSVDTDSGDSDVTPLYSGDVLIDLVSSYDEVSGTITAYTYPDEFEPCVGSMEIISGIFLQQQDKTRFGLCYRSGIGNDINEEAGYRLHLIYNCELSNNSRSRSTINDSLELEELEFEFKTIPAVSDEYDPYSEIVIDSTKFSSEFMEQLEAILYGTDEEPPRLPDLDELIELFEVIDTSIPPEYEGYPYTFLFPSEDVYPYDGIRAPHTRVTIIIPETTIRSPGAMSWTNTKPEGRYIPAGSTDINIELSGIPDNLEHISWKASLSENNATLSVSASDLSLVERITTIEPFDLIVTIFYTPPEEG